MPKLKILKNFCNVTAGLAVLFCSNMAYFTWDRNVDNCATFLVAGNYFGFARPGGARYSFRQPRWNWSSNRGRDLPNSANTVRLRGRHLLDQEAITCLLVLLFVDEPKINTQRLYRVFRNLCYHPQTRQWVIRSLLSILHRTNECKVMELTDGSSSQTSAKSSGSSSDKLKKKVSSTVSAGQTA